jgi:hypothetical protein
MAQEQTQDQPQDQAPLPPPMERALQQDERLIWRGQPMPGAYVFGGLVVTAPLGLIAVASAMTWTQGVHLTSTPLWAQLVLGVLLVFAAHMILIRPLLGWHLARRTYYAITDRRALVVCDAWSGWTQELRHDQGTPLVVRGPRNFGKIQFCRAAGSSVDVILMGRAAIPGFYGLKEVALVHKLLISQRGEPARKAGQPG